MREYSFTEAKQHFAAILDEAKKEGVVCIKKRNGETFYLRLANSKTSPLDVKSVDLGLNKSNIIEVVRKEYEKNYKIEPLS